MAMKRGRCATLSISPWRDMERVRQSRSDLKRSRRRSTLGSRRTQAWPDSGLTRQLLPRYKTPVQMKLFFILLVLVSSGCVGQGEVILLDLRSTPNAVHSSVSPTAPLKIAVAQFEEVNRVRLWNRSHMMGGETYFTVPGGRPIRVLGRLLAEYFNQRGWQAWDTASETHASPAGADVTITGAVQEFSVTATSYFGRTWLKANIKMTIVATNAKDGSTVRMTLEHDTKHRLFWFEPEDIRAIVLESINGTLTKFVLNTRVDERSIRIR